ncbi:multicopper oxidase family protein [Pseudonocardia ailaonensis]|uniref:Multicopper oxidase CueO n=1 Tax=Pseudonocardia ailaonensis TaxID=367279 RepID=A0ABN2NMP4_9PSEU
MGGVSRRAVLGTGLVAGIGLAVGIPFAVGASGSSSTGNLVPSTAPLPPAFVRPLAVPRVLQPVRRSADTDFYEITQQRATAAILPGPPTEIWGYEGTFPGPTLVSRRGRRTVVTHTNRLPVPTVVHLHGGEVPEESDGYPTDYVHPAGMSSMDMGGMAGNVSHGSRTYTYPVDQRAATLWYHDHRMDFTGPSVWRGLAGFHLVRDDEEDALGLPSGDRELPLMIMDRSFGADGSLLYPSVDRTLTRIPGVGDGFVAGVLGDVMLVNGAPWPVATVDGATYRLRILNACNARRLSLRLDPPPPGGLVQIGSDGGLLAAPAVHDHVELAPAERFDLLVDFGGYRPGSVVRLVNDFGSDRTSEVAQFRVGPATAPPYRIPDRLSTVDPIDPAEAVTTRTMQFRSGRIGGMRGWLVNGAPFTPDTAAASVRAGSVEIWRLVTDFHHPIHLHLQPFQVLSRGIDGPGPFDAGWKDTLDLRPAEEAAIAIRFGRYPGRYVFHCHNLEHEDMAMMANVVVA